MGCRRAQVTIFVIVGILLLAVVALVLYSGSREQEYAAEQDIAKPVAEYLDACAADAAGEAVRIVSRQGGYYDVPKEHSYMSGFRVADYYSGAPMVPTLDMIESELGKAAVDRFSSCDLSGLSTLGYAVEVKDLGAVVTSTDLGVRFIFTYRAEIIGEDQVSTLSESQAFIPVGLGKSFGVAWKFVEEQAKDPRYIPLAYLSDLCVASGLLYEMHSDQGHTVYSLISPDRLRDEQYTFVFGIDYGPDFIYLNRPLFIETPILYAKAGKEFIYRLNYTDAYAYTSLFNATGGEIRFTPEAKDIGMHDVQIIANTTSGWVTISMSLNITGVEDA